MKKTTLILLVIGAAALLTVSYCQFWKGDNAATVVNPETMGSPPPEGEQPKSKSKAEIPSHEATGAAPSASGFLPTQMEDAGKFEALQKHLKEMGHCLNMVTSPLDAQSEFNFENLNTAISADLGDVVTQSEEWTATDIRTKSGELRRIYLENSPDTAAEPRRTLKYYSLQGGSQKEIPLSKEQMTNPSDALVASLESDGDVVGRSLSRRIYYQNGDDLLLVERNGKIYSLELPHDGKTFRCTGLDSTKTMKCECK
ncbi:hypothetical protein [Bdellovibrio sp.]|uniref:hypothetical protein n=1 Tax=Bdellovibrio sp. TaxID=28201 RepID=UPI0039E55297